MNREELTDNATNEIMDEIRAEFKLNSDTDKDDKLYSFIWNRIKTLVDSIN